MKRFIGAATLFWSSPALAPHGLDAAAGIIEYTYYALLVVITVPLGFAIALRKRRKFSNWLMVVLIFPTILFSALSLFFSAVALYIADTKDIRIGVIFAIVGFVQLIVVQRLYASCKRHHQVET